MKKNKLVVHPKLQAAISELPIFYHKDDKKFIYMLDGKDLYWKQAFDRAKSELLSQPNVQKVFQSYYKGDKQSFENAIVSGIRQYKKNLRGFDENAIFWGLESVLSFIHSRNYVATLDLITFCLRQNVACNKRIVSKILRENWGEELKQYHHKGKKYTYLPEIPNHIKERKPGYYSVNKYPVIKKPDYGSIRHLLNNLDYIATIEDLARKSKLTPAQIGKELKQREDYTVKPWQFRLGDGKQKKVRLVIPPCLQDDDEALKEAKNSLKTTYKGELGIVKLENPKDIAQESTVNDQPIQAKYKFFPKEYGADTNEYNGEPLIITAYKIQKRHKLPAKQLLREHCFLFSEFPENWSLERKCFEAYKNDNDGYWAVVWNLESWHHHGFVDEQEVIKAIQRFDESSEPVIETKQETIAKPRQEIVPEESMTAITGVGQATNKQPKISEKYAHIPAFKLKEDYDPLLSAILIIESKFNIPATEIVNEHCCFFLDSHYSKDWTLEEKCQQAYIDYENDYWEMVESLEIAGKKEELTDWDVFMIVSPCVLDIE